MKLEIAQQVKLSQQMVMTPRLQMAIKLLQLNQIELRDTIRQELEENPALDEAQDAQDHVQEEPKPEIANQAKIKEVQIKEDISNDVDWNNYLDEYNSAGKIHFETEKQDTTNFESFITPKKSLQDHLLWQLLMTSPTPEEETIGNLIVGNLDSNGYLETLLEEIATMGNLSYEKAEQVLTKMQTFDPIGVCARNLGECLIIQAKHFNLDNTIVTEIITNHLNHLETKNYKAISRALKVSIRKVISAVNIITGLEPKPGREFSDYEPQYIIPDIFVQKVGKEFVIILNDQGVPTLCLNSFYKNAIKKGIKIPDNAKNYVKEKMRSAVWLIHSVQQRQETIYKVMESILKFQKEFFAKGIKYLKPMVLKDVARDLNMHESTISRVTTNKYVHIPSGIFELKYFFNSSIKSTQGKDLASAIVQDNIKKIIQNESAHEPFSDEKIVNILKSENIDIARRTVAKYRDRMKILSSNKRKKI